VKRAGVLLAALLASGCAAPAVHSFLLSGASAGSTAAPVLAGPRPMLLLRPVRMPDHLDTRDMLVRDGLNRIRGSRTGRWADRLSVGLRQALAEDLQNRLPGQEVVTDAAPPGPFLRLTLDVSRFDLFSDGTLVLQARWRLDRVDARAARQLAGGEIALTRGNVPVADEAEAAAMSGMTDDLAARLAALIDRAPITPAS
jgi:uncharacterized protein